MRLPMIAGLVTLVRGVPTACAPGSFNDGVACIECAAGFWGDGTTSVAAGAECSGSCYPGFHCAPASTSPDGEACGSAQYYCPYGRRLAVGAGYYTTPETVGSASRTGAARCPVGYFCVDGLRARCEGGTYGETTGLATAVCSGDAPAGTYAPAGSKSPIDCPTRHFCIRATAVPQPCPAGTYGATTRMTSAQCSGMCSQGHYCQPRSASAAEHACPAGRFGSSAGLASAACDGPALAGYWTESGATNATQHRCGSTAVFCPTGSASPIAVASGHYSFSVKAMLLGESANNSAVALDGHPFRRAEWLTEREARALNMAKFPTAAARAAALSGEMGDGKSTLRIAVHATASAQRPCEAGSFCSTRGIGSASGRPGGVRMPCALGRFASSASSACDSRCPPGTFCPEGSAAPTQCPAGRYGATYELGDAACTAAAPRGRYADAGSASAALCPAGRFSRVQGTTSAAACEAGRSGTYAAAGQVEAHRCGAGDASCAAGAAAPRRVLLGYYTDDGAVDRAEGGTNAGDATRRAAMLECPPGFWCKRGKKRACGPGRWSSGTAAGGPGASNSSACEGACRAGFFCAAASTSATHDLCPAGRWGGDGMRSAACAGPCRAGSFCDAGSASSAAAPCTVPGDSSRYCPEGVAAPLVAPSGWYTITVSYSSEAALAEIESRNASRRSEIARCPLGHYCANGIRSPCPAGASLLCARHRHRPPVYVACARRLSHRAALPCPPAPPPPPTISQVASAIRAPSRARSAAALRAAASGPRTAPLRDSSIPARSDATARALASRVPQPAPSAGAASSAASGRRARHIRCSVGGKGGAYTYEVGSFVCCAPLARRETAPPPPRPAARSWRGETRRYRHPRRRSAVVRVKS